MNRKALAELQNMQNSCLGGARVSRVMPVRLGPIASRNRRLSGKDLFWRLSIDVNARSRGILFTPLRTKRFARHFHPQIFHASKLILRPFFQLAEI